MGMLVEITEPSFLLVTWPVFLKRVVLATRINFLDFSSPVLITEGSGIENDISLAANQ